MEAKLSQWIEPMDAKKILISGASGFVGRCLVHYLLASTQAKLILPIRGCSTDIPSTITDNVRVEVVEEQDLCQRIDWSAMLEGVEVVIHLAALLQSTRGGNQPSLTDFREINTKATLNLASQASLIGVRRFIYLSTIKVHGEYTQLSQPFTEEFPARPTDPYAVSKYEAEQGLVKIAQQGDIEVVLIRPPLVYGPGVKGNFHRVIQLLQKNHGAFLPFGSLHKNKRSFISVDNLVDIIALCIEHPAAGNQVFLVSDDEDLSTKELMRKFTHFMGKKALFLPIPGWALKSVGKILGKNSEMKRLCDSLHIDISKSKHLLGWQPKEPFDEALKKMIAEYE